MRKVSDWQTYRNGNPRGVCNLERLARHRAAKLDYRVHRSRRRKGRDNAGELMLIHKASLDRVAGRRIHRNRGVDPLIHPTGDGGAGAVRASTQRRSK
jgi:hypothetical protein